MAVKTLYLKGGTLQNSFQPIQDGGTAPTDAFFATATGWVSGAVANGTMSELRPNVNRARTTFLATPVVPTAITTGANANAFVTPTAYSGTFPAGNWTLSASMRAAVAQPSTMRLRWRVFASTDATGATGVRELTTGVLLSGNGVGFTTTANTVMSVTWAAPAVTLNNEYLFFACAQEMVTLSGTGNTRDSQFRQNSSSAITTTNLALTQSATDTLPLADGATSALSKARAPTADALGLADSNAASQDKQRTRVDSLAVADGVSPQLILGGLEKSATDALGLADSATRILTLPRAVTESLALADSQSRALSGARVLVDSLGVQDATTRIRALSRSSADSLALADSLSTVRTIARAMLDTLVLADAVSSQGAGQINRSITDALSVLDAVSSARAIVRSNADALTLADAAVQLVALHRALGDELLLADTSSIEGNLARAFVDTLALEDFFTSDAPLVLPSELTPSNGRNVATLTWMLDEAFPRSYRASNLVGESKSTAIVASNGRNAARVNR